MPNQISEAFMLNYISKMKSTWMRPMYDNIMSPNWWNFVFLDLGAPLLNLMGDTQEFQSNNYHSQIRLWLIIDLQMKKLPFAIMQTFVNKLTISLTFSALSDSAGVLNNRRRWSWLLTRRHVPSGDHLHPFRQLENLDCFRLKQSLAKLTSLGCVLNMFHLEIPGSRYQNTQKPHTKERAHMCAHPNKPPITSSMKGTRVSHH